MNGAAFKVGQKVVFTAAGNEALAAEGRAAIMQGSELSGPKDGIRYAVGTVTDCSEDRVTVAVQGLSGLGEAFTLDSWYAACSACVRENVALPMPPEPGKPTCKAHATKKAEKAKDKSGEGMGEDNINNINNNNTKGETVANKGNKDNKAAKAPKEKAAKATGAGRKSAWPEDSKIEVLIEENPRREGTFSHKVHAGIKKFHGKTVGECLAAARKVDAKFLSETQYILRDGLAKKHYKIVK